MSSLSKAFDLLLRTGVPTVEELASTAGVGLDEAKEWYNKQIMIQLFKKPSPKVKKIRQGLKYNNPVVWSSLEMDLLFMPHDNSDGKIFRYILVVVDTSSRYRLAAALTNKTTAEVSDAVIKMPIPWDKVEVVATDQGTEFKGAFEAFLKRKYIRHFISMRHLPLVETSNRLISTRLFSLQSQTELETGEVSREWVNRLHEVVEKINNTMNVEIKMSPADAIKVEITTQPLPKFKKPDKDLSVPLGAFVRRLLLIDEVLDLATKRIKRERRRATDPYWSFEIYEVISEIISPDFGVKMYRIKPVNLVEAQSLPNYYTYWELQVLK